jgi:hypothetical protein
VDGCAEVEGLSLFSMLGWWNEDGVRHTVILLLD